MAPDYTKRLDQGVDHEIRVARLLRALGWHVDHIGQGFMDPSVSKMLKRVDTALRWFPDLIAVHRDFPDTPILIDAKNGRQDTPNWSAECAALQSHAGAQRWSGLDVFYVWPDLSWNTHDQLMEASDRNVITQGTFSGSGSGTSFVLIPKSVTNPWERFRPVVSISEHVGPRRHR